MDKSNYRVQRRSVVYGWEDWAPGQLDAGFHNLASAQKYLNDEREWDRAYLTQEDGSTFIFDYRIVDQNSGHTFTTLGTGY